MGATASDSRLLIRAAEFPAETETVRALFLAYARSLGFDLSFQNFDAEVAALPGAYAPPSGGLFLGFVDGEPMGCVAFRRLDAEICEMKRLYVNPQSRRLRLGGRLAREVIEAGRQAGYKAMRLDTIRTMQAAMDLYRSLGFRSIPPYRPNPIEGAEFMELTL